MEHCQIQMHEMLVYLRYSFIYGTNPRGLIVHSGLCSSSHLHTLLRHIWGGQNTSSNSPISSNEIMTPLTRSLIASQRPKMATRSHLVIMKRISRRVHLQPRGNWMRALGIEPGQEGRARRGLVMSCYH